MRIYFTASIAGKQRLAKQYLGIIDQLKQRGHEVICDHIVKTSEEQIHNESSHDRKAFQSQVERWIRGADCVIAETSCASVSVGYEVSLALQAGKPVFVLYSEGDAPSLFPDLNSEQLIVEKYTLDNLSSLLDDFLSYAQGARDTRFTFFLSQEQSHYLKRRSQQLGLPKSLYLRNLIDQDRKNTSS